MKKDPIVEEVRAIRESLAREWKNDPEGFAAKQERITRNWPGKTVTREELLANKRKATTPHQ